MADLDRASLQRRWVHSHEEDPPGRLVFRPGTWNFPPSRGRRSFDLGPNGELRSAGPGPTDKTVETTGRWRLLPGDVIELAPKGGQKRLLKIIELGPDKLVVAR